MQVQVLSSTLRRGVRVRFIVSVLKTDVRKRTVGSNPTLSAICQFITNTVLTVKTKTGYVVDGL